MSVTPTKAHRFRRSVVDLAGMLGGMMLFAVTIAWLSQMGLSSWIQPSPTFQWARWAQGVVLGMTMILCSGIAAGWPVDCDGKHCECRDQTCCFCGEAK
jgi:hypothetical protein